MEIQRKKITADVCSYIDEDNGKLNLEINVPGVLKDKIKLRMQDDNFNLIAPRDSFDYVSTGSFCCPVKSTDAVANFENGLLRVSVPFKDPMEGAFEVPIH